MMLAPYFYRPVMADVINITFSRHNFSELFLAPIFKLVELEVQPSLKSPVLLGIQMHYNQVDWHRGLGGVSVIHYAKILGSKAMTDCLNFLPGIKCRPIQKAVANYWA